LHNANQFQKLTIKANSINQAKKSLFLKLPGDILSLLGDFLNEKLPLFIFTNRISFKMSLHYQIGYYEHQRQLMLA
jgi:hypothetical protein